MPIHLLGLAGAALIATGTFALVNHYISSEGTASSVSVPQPSAISQKVSTQVTQAVQSALPGLTTSLSQSVPTATALVQQVSPTLANLDAQSVKAITGQVSTALGVQAPSDQVFTSILDDYSRVFRCMNYHYNQWFLKGVIESTAAAAINSDPTLASVLPEMGRFTTFLSQGVAPSASDCSSIFS